MSINDDEINFSTFIRYLINELYWFLDAVSGQQYN